VGRVDLEAECLVALRDDGERQADNQDAALEEMLSQFPGAMLCISHDREFMDNLCNKVWELSPRGLRQFDGNYSEYREALVRERDGISDARIRDGAPTASSPKPCLPSCAIPPTGPAWTSSPFRTTPTSPAA